MAYLRREIMEQVSDRRKQGPTRKRDASSWFPIGRVLRHPYTGKVVGVHVRSFRPVENDPTFIEGRSQSGNMRPSTHSKAKKGARRAAKLARRRNR